MRRTILGRCLCLLAGTVIATSLAQVASEAQAPLPQVAGATGADLSLSSAASTTSVLSGNNLTYRFTAHNAGPGTATNTRIGGMVPQGAVFVRATASQGSCPKTPAVDQRGLVVCNVGTLGIDSTTNTATMTLVVRVVALKGTLVSQMKVISGVADPNPDNNTSSLNSDVLPRRSDLSVTMTGPPLAAPLTKWTYELTVRNAGPNGALGTRLVDQLPPAATFVSLIAPSGVTCDAPSVGQTGTVKCQLGRVRATTSGPGVVVKITVKGPSAGILHNLAIVRSRGLDGEHSDNKANVRTQVGNVNKVPSDVAVGLTGVNPFANPGENLKYLLSVANGGPAAAEGVVVDAQLPDGATLVSTEAPVDRASCSQTQTGVRCALKGPLSVGDGFVIPVTVRTPAASDPMVTTATVSQSADQDDTLPLNNGVTLVTPVAVPITPFQLSPGTVDRAPLANADVQVTETPVVDPVSGVLLTDVTVVNNGPDTADNVVVTTHFAQGVRVRTDVVHWTFGSVSLDTSTDPPGVIWKLGSLPANVGSTLRVGIFVDEATLSSHPLSVSFSDIYGIDAAPPDQAILQMAASVSRVTTTTYDANATGNLSFIAIAPKVVNVVPATVVANCQQDWGKFGALLGGQDCSSPTSSLTNAVAMLAALAASATGIGILDTIILTTFIIAAAAAESAVLV